MPLRALSLRCTQAEHGTQGGAKTNCASELVMQSCCCKMPSLDALYTPHPNQLCAYD